MDLIGARIPRFVVGQWVNWCRVRDMGQAEAIRLGIAMLIESDEKASKEDLALAAIIRDAPTKRPRG